MSDGSPSIRSLAKQLGVSVATVSLALRNSSHVSEELRARITDAARHAGYIPNARLAKVMAEVRHSQQAQYQGTLLLFSLYPEIDPWRTRPHLKLVTDAARKHAAELGYSTDSLWFTKPGLSPARFVSILEARGIDGLLCLGSLDVNASLPAEVLTFPVVTFGASVSNPVSRVMSHFPADARLLFSELIRRGYRNPGVVMLPSGDERTGYFYSDAFLGLQHRAFTPPYPPILKNENWDETEFGAWYHRYRPDVIVLHHRPDYIGALSESLARRGLRVPESVGLALLDMNPDPARYAGVCQNFPQMGVAVIDLLVERCRQFGTNSSATPKIELVLGQWNEGQTLRTA